MSEVKLSTVTKRFGKVAAVEGMDLTIPDGAFVVLLGPTGAGKTTTLRLIAGLETPDEGEILIDGRIVNREMPAQRDVAMVFQQYSLYPHMTVRDNLAFPLRSPVLKTPEDEIKRKVESVAKVLHIPHKLDNKATELSGGEMQRVSIGRALVRDPAIYLMDEPLSSLDAKLRADLRIELKRIHAEIGATLLYVTHDQIEAMTMASHVGVLDQGHLLQGALAAEGELAAHGLVEHHAQGPHVGGRGRLEGLAADLLGGHEQRRAHVGAGPRQPLVAVGVDGQAQVEHHRGRLRQPARAAAGDGDRLRVHLFQCRQQLEHLFGLAALREDHYHVVAVDASQVAMKRLGRVQEVAPRAGAGQRGGQLLADQPRLAHASDDHARLASKQQIDRPAELGIQPRGQAQ